jgi:hypothetical protein
MSPRRRQNNGSTPVTDLDQTMAVVTDLLQLGTGLLSAVTHEDVRLITFLLWRGTPRDLLETKLCIDSGEG